MRVTIIIPVYNVALYVEECIRSVMNQTMTEGVECIIVDDGGQDNSMEIVYRVLANEGYEELTNAMLTSPHSPLIFRIIHHEKNRGLSAARNTGIKAAIGKYIYFMDSDDWIDCCTIQSMLGCVDKYPNVQIVQGGALRTRGNQDMALSNCNFPEYTEDRKKIKIDYFCKLQLPPTAWNKLILRTFIIKNNLYFKEGLIEEDILWDNELSKCTTSVCVLKIDCYHYRQREGSIMNGVIRNDFTNILNIFQIIIRNIDEEYRIEQADSVLNHLYRMLRKNNDYAKRISKLIRHISVHYPFIRQIKLWILSILLQYVDIQSKSWSRDLCTRLEKNESGKHICYIFATKMINWK